MRRNFKCERGYLVRQHVRNEYVQEIGLYTAYQTKKNKRKKTSEVEVYRRIRLSSNSTSDASYGEIIYSTASLGILYTLQLAQWVEMRRTKSL